MENDVTTQRHICFLRFEFATFFCLSQTKESSNSNVETRVYISAICIFVGDAHQATESYDFCLELTIESSTRASVEIYDTMIRWTTTLPLQKFRHVGSTAKNA